MISRELARALREAGLGWEPRSGDTFAIPDRDLDEHVFVLSDMVIQTVDVPGGPPVLAFNGTTEWALDNLEAHEAIWLPREDQLRDLLGTDLAALERLAGDPEGYAVTLLDGQRYVDVDAACAYGRALLATLLLNRGGK